MTAFPGFFDEPGRYFGYVPNIGDHPSVFGVGIPTSIDTIGHAYDHFCHSFGTREPEFFLGGIAQPIEITSAIRKWSGLVLLGPVGSGKTFIAKAVERDYNVEHPWRCELHRAVDLGEYMKHEHQLQSLRERPVIIIDDIGTSTLTPTVVAKLYDILDRRYDAQLPTIVTSNLDPIALVEAIGERAFDRLTGPTLILPSSKSRRRSPVKRPKRFDLRIVWEHPDIGPYRERGRTLIEQCFDAGIYEALRNHLAPEHQAEFVRIVLDVFDDLDREQLHADEVLAEHDAWQQRARS